MGIRSTKTITRTEALNRIAYVLRLVQCRDYRKLDRDTFENGGVEEFVDDSQSLVSHPKNYTNYTNEMLGNFMDEPFFRFSMFDNYIVVDSQS